MSAMSSEGANGPDVSTEPSVPAVPQVEHHDQVSGPDPTAVEANGPLEVRRNAGLAALVGATASAVAIAYLWRASQTASVLDWSLCVAMGALGVMFLGALVDSRTPLLVADELGVRFRLGREWRGLPWEALDRVVVRPRRHLLSDGRLVLAPRHLARALEGMQPRARRQILVGQKLYGAPLALPLGLSTRVVADGPLDAALSRLAAGRTEVLTLQVASRRADETTPETTPETAPETPADPYDPMVRAWGRRWTPTSPPPRRASRHPSPAGPTRSRGRCTRPVSVTRYAAPSDWPPVDVHRQRTSSPVPSSPTLSSPMCTRTSTPTSTRWPARSMR